MRRCYKSLLTLVSGHFCIIDYDIATAGLSDKAFYHSLLEVNKKLSSCRDSSRYDNNDSGRLANPNYNPKYVSRK